MADNLEKTGEAQRGHELATGEIPIVVSDSARHDLYGRNMPAADIDWGTDADVPLSCSTDPGEPCESCT